ncbi:MAG: Nif3-like dinuclear metal center hexameric protein [Dysgonamonadaceae bacterium]|jgi:dinuclear metal center YbgI/SA1388 family protein|nr:Nif3-like dinuclear metal center hexameric protein [Dysgonamonadaceae bacterium]
MKISQIIIELENYAPLSIQETFDNSGLQIGDTSREARGVLLSLDVTEKVVEEAINMNCNLIISHHPLLFKPVKKITGKTYTERCIIKACKHDIVVYASHTNMDNAFGGVNYHLARKIGLQNVRALSPKKDCLLKLVTFVPETHAEMLRNALFNAGAGQIGNYDSCSFNASGYGSFRAGNNTHPYVGNINELHTEPEIRIETIVPTYKKQATLRALLSAHPYEEPAYDFYSIENDWRQIGSGIVGELPAPEDEKLFLQKLKTIFNLETLKHSPFTGKPIKKVALCGGSGAFLIPDAIACDTDIFITGEARYNDYYDVENHILLAVIGHYESEVAVKEIFYDIIIKKIPNVTVHLSTVNTNPVNFI